MSAGLHAEGQSDTRAWVSLTLAKQSGLYNAQNFSREKTGLVGRRTNLIQC